MSKLKKYDLCVLVLRVASGVMMLTHGIPKLMMLFSGGEIQFADPIGLGPAVSLFLAVFAEVVCSVALIVGFKTRIFTIPLIITMLVAIFVVHGSDPINVKEKAILYLAMYVALAFSGSGSYSIDRKI